jgi:hypothetical protein
MKNFVPTGAGYLQGGLQRENWERCTLAIVRMASKTSILPGINFLIKHVGSIFRSLFQAALIDMTYQNSNTEQLMKNCPLLKIEDPPQKYIRFHGVGLDDKCC